MLAFSGLWCAERARKIMERKPRVPPKIITSHVYPPIPTRVFDWSAHWECREEGPYGFGPTEPDAIRDLTDNYDEPE